MRTAREHSPLAGLPVAEGANCPGEPRGAAAEGSQVSRLCWTRINREIEPGENPSFIVQTKIRIVYPSVCLSLRTEKP